MIRVLAVYKNHFLRKEIASSRMTSEMYMLPGNHRKNSTAL